MHSVGQPAGERDTAVQRLRIRRMGFTTQWPLGSSLSKRSSEGMVRGTGGGGGGGDSGKSLEITGGEATKTGHNTLLLPSGHFETEK